MKKEQPMGTVISMLTAEQALAQWNVIESKLAPSLEHGFCGRSSIADCKAAVADQTCVIMIAWEPEEHLLHAVFLASIDEHPNKRVFSLNAAGGGAIDKWGHLWPAFERFARDYECDQIEVYGRRGWKKYIDAEEVATVFVKELEAVSSAEEVACHG